MHWILIIIVYVYNPTIPHTHYQEKVDKKYFRTEEECLQMRDIFVSQVGQFGAPGPAQVGCFPIEARELHVN